MDFYGTIGPACADVKLLQQMVEAGMTGIRMNLSHGPLAAHKDWLALLRKAGVKKLLIDLQALPRWCRVCSPGRSCCWMTASCWHGWTPQSRMRSCAP